MLNYILNSRLNIFKLFKLYLNTSVYFNSNNTGSKRKTTFECVYDRHEISMLQYTVNGLFSHNPLHTVAYRNYM